MFEEYIRYLCTYGIFAQKMQTYDKNPEKPYTQKGSKYILYTQICKNTIYKYILLFQYYTLSIQQKVSKSDY